MTKLTLLIISCFLWRSAAAIPPIPEIPPFPTIESNHRIYHVQNELGKDSINSGTEKHPWKTLKYATKQLRAGDTLIAHGTKSPYSANNILLEYSGNEDGWITIKGENSNSGDRVTLLGRLTLGRLSNGSASYIHLDNLVFQGHGGGHNININRGSHHIVFENIEIDCKSSPKNRRAIWTENNTHHIWYKDTTVHHCGYKRNPNTKPTPSSWKPPTDCGGICIKGDNISEIVFLNVKATDNVGDGIGGGSKKAYGNSYFKNCISERNTGDGFDLGGTHTVFINSISRNNNGHQGAGFKSWSKELWLVNSVAYNNYTAGILLKPQHEGISNAYILNSTFANNNSIGTYGGQISTSNKHPATGKLFLYIYNNIFLALNSSAITISNNNTQYIKEEGHNYYFSANNSTRKPHWTHTHAVHIRDSAMKAVEGYSFLEMADKQRWHSDTGNGAKNIGEIRTADKLDPGFLNLDTGDLRLSKDSLAIDNGTALGINFDINGTPRPSGTAPDIGAYEFTSGQK